MNGWASRRRPLGGLTMIAASILFGLSPSRARATVPVQARLTLVDTHGNTVGNGTEQREYVGIRLPDGEVLPFAGNGDYVQPGVRMRLQVQFEGSSTLLDVTSDPNTSFFSVPTHPLRPMNGFEFSIPDAGLDLTIYGHYTDPQSGMSVSGRGSVSVRVFPAAFLDLGPAQSRLVSQLDQFSANVVAWWSTVGIYPVGWSVARYLDRLKRIQLLLQVGFTYPIAGEVMTLEADLLDLRAPQALVIRINQIIRDMAQEGVLSFFPGSLPSGLGDAIPSWVVPPPVIVGAAAPVVAGVWLDLGDDGDW